MSIFIADFVSTYNYICSTSFINRNGKKYVCATLQWDFFLIMGKCDMVGIQVSSKHFKMVISVSIVPVQCCRM